LRHFWFNPHDPAFLRYAATEDMRNVSVIPIAGSTLKWAENRAKADTQKMIENCHRRWRCKIVNGRNAWSLYFQSAQDYNAWKSLMEAAGQGARAKPAMNADDAFWEARYGPKAGQHKEPFADPASPSPTGKSPTHVMVRVELPLCIGTVTLDVDSVDPRSVTMARLKERCVEAAHLELHAPIANEPDPEDVPSKITYSARVCPMCHCALRLPSRMTYKQEQMLCSDLSFFMLRRRSVIEGVKPVPLNGRPLHGPFLGSGVYPGPNDQALLRFLAFTPGTPVFSGVSGSISSTSSARVTPSVEDDYDMWVTLEDETLEAHLEKLLPTGLSGGKAWTVTYEMRASRELPVARFKVTVDEFVREVDASGEFSLYTLSVRQGFLEWQVKRRYADFADLHAGLVEDRVVNEWLNEGRPPKDSLVRRISLRAEPVLHVFPSLPPRKLATSRAVTMRQAEEQRLVELTAYLSAVLALPPIWQSPPVALLSFLGVLSTGEVDLKEHKSFRHKRMQGAERSMMNVLALKDVAEFGDLVLLRSLNRYSGLQRSVTGSVFDHVGMVIKRPRRRHYEFLEATGEGVTCFPLAERLEAYSRGFCDLIALRKVNFPRTKEALAALAMFANTVEGKPYSLSLTKLSVARMAKTKASQASYSASSQRNYFCSELCAEALKIMQVIDSPLSNSFFWPNSFDVGGDVEKLCKPGCSFGALTFIDCTVPEIGSSVEKV